MKLQAKKDNLLQFFEAVQKVNDTFILDIKDDNTGSVIAVTADETCFLYATTQFQESVNATLNIPDCKKLVRALKYINEDDVVLKITSNALKYSSKATRFTYHLYDENFLKRPKINPDKVKSFNFNVCIDLKKDDIRQLVRNSSFVDSANKLYLYTENGSLMGEITDRERANTDSFTIAIAQNVTAQLDPIIVKLDNMQMLHLCNDDVQLKINTQLGLLAFELDFGLNKLMYILTSLKK